MRKTNKIALSASALIAIGIVGALLTYGKEKPKEFEIDKTPNQAFSSIQAKANNAAIEIKRSKSLDAKAVLTGSQKKNREVKLNSEIRNGKWLLTVKENRFRFLSLDLFALSHKLTIYLPEQSYNQIKLHSDNGRITVKQANSNKFDVKSSNGRIEFTDIKAENINQIKLHSDNGRITVKQANSNKFDVKSSNGRIEFTDVKAEEIQATTDNGKLSFINTLGNIHARSDNGRIEFEGKTILHNLDFGTDNGRIQIDLDEKPKDFQVGAQTDHGKVQIFGEDYKKQVLIQGNGPALQLQTDNGRIEVNAN